VLADRACECRARVNICGHAPNKTTSKKSEFWIKQELQVLDADGAAATVKHKNSDFSHVGKVTADEKGEHWVTFKAFSNRDLGLPVTGSALPPKYRFRFSVDWAKMALAPGLKWVDTLNMLQTKEVRPRCLNPVARPLPVVLHLLVVLQLLVVLHLMIATAERRASD